MSFLSKLFANKNAGNETDNVYVTGTLEQVTALIESGAKVNAKNNTGFTPLFYVAMHNPNPEVIVVLIKAGADVNAKSKDGNTPLIFAAKKNPNPEVIAALVKAGADVNAKSEKDYKLIHFAAQFNPNPDMIVALVKAGMDVNAKIERGMTPLMIAIISNPNPEVIATLIKFGADVNAKDNNGSTPASFAWFSKNLYAQKILLEAGSVDEKRQVDLVASILDGILVKLKSSDSAERKKAAERLGLSANIEKRALQPLFEALMNWNEEDDNIRVISIALFKNLWVTLDHTVQRSILDALAPGGNYLFFQVLMEKVVCVQIFGKDMNEHLNPGQTEKVNTMLRYALKEDSVRSLMVR